MDNKPEDFDTELLGGALIRCRFAGRAVLWLCLRHGLRLPRAVKRGRAVPAEPQSVSWEVSSKPEKGQQFQPGQLRNEWKTLCFCISLPGAQRDRRRRWRGSFALVRSALEVVAGSTQICALLP